MNTQNADFCNDDKTRYIQTTRLELKGTNALRIPYRDSILFSARDHDSLKL